MSARYQVRPFEERDAPQAGAFMASRHRAGRLRFPNLPARFENADACAEQVRSTMNFADGFAAEATGKLAGFLFGFKNLPSPTSGSARYAPERSSMMLAHSHGVAPGEEPFPVYNALFAALAERFAADGIFEHFVHVPAGDPSLDEAWNDLGFGRMHAAAARSTNPSARRSGCTIRQAGPADLELVSRLVDEESRFHAGAPIFRAYLSRDTSETVRNDLRKALADEGQAIFVGAPPGQTPGGVISIGPSRGSPMFTPDDSAYIGDTAVLSRQRDSGLGSALLQEALAWGREHGYLHATLHFATANPVSSAFWQGHGFVPVMYHLRRSLDQRIAWAKPTTH